MLVYRSILSSHEKSMEQNERHAYSRWMLKDLQEKKNQRERHTVCVLNEKLLITDKFHVEKKKVKINWWIMLVVHVLVFVCVRMYECQVCCSVKWKQINAEEWSINCTALPAYGMTSYFCKQQTNRSCCRINLLYKLSESSNKYEILIVVFSDNFKEKFPKIHTFE